ncbi:hypothetical protein SDC9_145588 [bioreactor metagenome]|uniref:Uncharacterized protein n=1 Tax=bioreactor metagenome TaxID=1076179 RepID=A0A645ECL7_9ZZZZ
MKRKLLTIVSAALIAVFIVCILFLVQYGIFILTRSIVAVMAVFTALLMAFMLKDYQEKGEQ